MLIEFRCALKVILAAICLSLAAWGQQPLKLGIVGLGSSHAVRFAELLNDEAAELSKQRHGAPVALAEAMEAAR